jgi:hypothetical protein
MDEPTAALAVAETRKVLDLARRLADRGCAVVFISHNLVEVFEVADRMAVNPSALASACQCLMRSPSLASRLGQRVRRVASSIPWACCIPASACASSSSLQTTPEHIRMTSRTVTPSYAELRSRGR